MPFPCRKTISRSMTKLQYHLPTVRLAVLLLTSASLSVSAIAAQLPNIVIIYADDLGLRRPVVLQPEGGLPDAAARPDGRRGHPLHRRPQPVDDLLAVALRPLFRPADLPLHRAGRRSLRGARRAELPETRHAHPRRHAAEEGIPHRASSASGTSGSPGSTRTASGSAAASRTRCSSTTKRARRWSTARTRAASTNRSSPRTARRPIRSTSTSRTAWCPCPPTSATRARHLPNPGGKWRWDNDEGWMAPGYEFVKADLLFYDKTRAVHHRAPEEAPGEALLRGALDPDRPRAGPAGTGIQRRDQGRPPRRLRPRTRRPGRPAARPAQGARDRRRHARPLQRRQRRRDRARRLDAAGPRPRSRRRMAGHEARRLGGRPPRSVHRPLAGTDPRRPGLRPDDQHHRHLRDPRVGRRLRASRRRGDGQLRHAAGDARHAGRRQADPARTC